MPVAALRKSSPDCVGPVIIPAMDRPKSRTFRSIAAWFGSSHVFTVIGSVARQRVAHAAHHPAEWLPNH